MVRLECEGRGVYAFALASIGFSLTDVVDITTTLHTSSVLSGLPS